MTLPTVVMCSMWRNDIKRRLVDRVEHLLAKAETYPNLRYVWVVGDSTDGTIEALWDLSNGYNVDIVNTVTYIDGDDAKSRLRRLSATANKYFEDLGSYDDQYILIHESDILSPSDIVNRLVAHALDGRCPIAAWPTLEIRPGRRIFYDCLCYRKDGQMFSNLPPYHPCYRPNEVFEVDSAGTVMLFHAEDARHIHMTDGGFLDLCRQLREQGRKIYVDPQIEVIQPHDLWQYHRLEEYA